MHKLLTALITILLILVLDYILIAALVYSISWCFGLVFSWKITLGIWLVLIAIKLYIPKQ